MISSVPRRCWEIARERISSSVITPPALTLRRDRSSSPETESSSDAYRRTVTDWQRAQARRKGAPAHLPAGRRGT
jgi:hypothetical protein